MPTEGFRCARRPHQRGPSTVRDDAGDRRGVRLQSAGSLVEASKNRGSTNGRPTRRSHSPPSKTTGYGQAAPSPGQYTWRHIRVDGWKPSDGQFGPLPGHVSATSQAPADGRQTVPADLNWSAGQSALLPAQVSATSQAPADARQTVPAESSPSAGQSRLVPVHVSATSQTPAEARHTVPVFPGAFSQNFTPPVPVAHVSTVQGLWSSQSASVLQFGGLITQSAGSEFGFWDG